MIALTLLVGGHMLWKYWQAPDAIWVGIIEDRFAHYDAGLRLALAWQDLDLVTAFSDIHKQLHWPPFHAVFLSMVLLVFGIDPRFAVLPSWLGWMVTAVLVWFLARRLLVGQGAAALLEKDQGSTPHPPVTPLASPLAQAGGWLGWALFLASPGQQAFAIDCMLESLGACFTVLSAWLYVCGRQAAPDRQKRWWTWLGVTMSLLFLHKYNYWLIVAIVIGLVEFLRAVPWNRHAWRNGYRATRRVLRDKRTWRYILTRPLLFPVLLGAALVIYIAQRGPTSIDVFGKSVSLYPPRNLLAITYLLLLILVGREAWKHRKVWWPKLWISHQQLLRWHAIPVLLYLALPKRLWIVFWFVSPAHTANDAGIDPLSGAIRYTGLLAEHYHPTTWLAVAVGVGMAVAIASILLTRWRGRAITRPGVAVPIALPLIAFALCATHPNQLPRFAHTWSPLLWVVADMGVIVLLGATLSAMRASQPTATAITVVARTLLIAAALVTAVAYSDLLAYPTESQETRAPLYPLVSPYQEAIHEPTSAAMFSNMPATFLLRTAHLKRFPNRHAVEVPLRFAQGDPKAFDHTMASWNTQSDTRWVVLLAVPKDSPIYIPSVLETDLDRLRDALNAMPNLKPVKQWDRPEGCRLYLWSREPLR